MGCDDMSGAYTGWQSWPKDETPAASAPTIDLAALKSATDAAAANPTRQAMTDDGDQFSVWTRERFHLALVASPEVISGLVAAVEAARDFVNAYGDPAAADEAWVLGMADLEDAVAPFRVAS